MFFLFLFSFLPTLIAFLRLSYLAQIYQPYSKTQPIQPNFANFNYSSKILPDSPNLFNPLKNSKIFFCVKSNPKNISIQKFLYPKPHFSSLTPQVSSNHFYSKLHLLLPLLNSPKNHLLLFLSQIFNSKFINHFFPPFHFNQKKLSSLHNLSLLVNSELNNSLIVLSPSFSLKKKKKKKLF
jgi:hypothetical protein